MDYENQIPQMTHPLSSGWNQPKTSEILVDKDSAIMSEETLKELHEYNCSLPSAAYSGKMWKMKTTTGYALVLFNEELPNDRIAIKYRNIILL